GNASETVRLLSIHLQRNAISVADRWNPDSQNSSDWRFILATWPALHRRSGFRAGWLAMAGVPDSSACFWPDPPAVLLLPGFARSRPLFHVGLYRRRLETKSVTTLVLNCRTVLG